jgi:GntR family histidine utilization transcriptional repressor
MQVKAPYAQVKNFLMQGLAAGKWPEGVLMPSDAALSKQFKVSRMTVMRALRELQAEGLVTRVVGLGTYAARLAKVSSSLQISDLHEEILSRGGQHRVVVHLATEDALPAALATQFGLLPGATIFHTQILHLENGVPLQLEDRYVNPECAPDYLRTDFTQITPTQYLMQVAPMWEAQYFIEAGRADPHEAALLQIAPEEPCLIHVRRTTNKGIPITLVRMVHPGARYRLEGAFKP